MAAADTQDRWLPEADVFSHASWHTLHHNVATRWLRSRSSPKACCGITRIEPPWVTHGLVHIEKSNDVRMLKIFVAAALDLPKENILIHSPRVDDLLAMKSHGTGTSHIKEGDLNLYGDLLTGTCADTTIDMS